MPVMKSSSAFNENGVCDSGLDGKCMGTRLTLDELT
jgi:hypothetical protein